MSTRADFQEHEMPSGATCYYRDSDHSYWTDIKPKTKQPDSEWSGVGRLTGVSTVSAPVDFRPDNLMRWSAKTNGKGIAMLAADALELDDAESIRDQLSWLSDADSIWRTLEAHSLTYEDLRDEAGERGTNVHVHALHELASGKPVPAYEEMTDEERGRARGVTEFWLEHDVQPLQAEQVVLDLELGVAGRLDLRCILDGEPAIVDLKTGFLALKHHTQLAGYEHCARVSALGETAAQYFLQVDEDGGYDLVPCRATVEDFIAAVDVYRRSGRIAKEAAADRRAR